MKNWIAGKGTATRVDPTVAAIFAAIAELIVMLDLHTKLGLSPEELLAAMIHVALIITLGRSVQLKLQTRRELAEAPPPDPLKPNG